MLYSLVQTLVCVLLINGGLYALHLKGNANDESKSMEPLLLPGLTNSHSEHSVQHASGSPYGSSASRLSEELADLAQLERERLMLLGIAKQTAVANAAAATGHHGRPIITGRIHMSPTDDVVSDGELARVLMPQPARGYMFGHVVKQPVQQNDGSDLQFAGGGMPGGTNNGGNGRDYEYGRIVKPAVVPEFDAQQVPLDLEAFMELEPESKSDEDDFDLDSYQYLDELLAEQQQRDWKQEVEHHRSNNPYQTVDDIDDGTPLALRELFNTEQQTSGYKHKGHQQQQQQQHQRQHQQQHSYPTNLRLQQKWLRKRAQQQHNGQQQPLRNIFDQKNHYQRSEESIAVKPPKPHYFNQRHHSLLLSTDNSEATANKNSHHNNQNNRAKMTSLVDEVMPATSNTRNHNSSPLEELQQQQEQQQQQVENQQSSASAAPGLKEMDDKNNSKQDLKQNTSGTSSYSNIDKQQQQQSLNLELEKKPQEELLLHPNHKRSGLGSSLLAPVLSAAGSHSMASQLMLRTARGQRQYDVPQIECPTAMDGMERFACPTPDLQGRYRCIDDHVLCDGFIDCPEGEDEDRRSCMFYKTTKAHLDVLADALLRWARGR